MSERISKWTDRATHDNVLLPSGEEVSIKVPDLPQMMKRGEIPNPLVKYVVKAEKNSADTLTEEKVIESTDYINWLISITVTDPEISPEEAEDVPAPDKELLVALATRQRDIDAAGRHLGGLETLEDFRRFRRVGEFSSPFDV